MPYIVSASYVHRCARFYNSGTAKGKRFDYVSTLLVEMRLNLESFCFECARFLLRTRSLVIWLAEIETRGVEM
jgi:hypothetical protein